MARVRISKTSFSGGEISSWLLGRGDLRAYETGALKLRNVCVHPAGGVFRRPGLRYMTTAQGKGRLVPFEFSTEQVYLLLFRERQIDILRDGAQIFSIASPWSEAHLRQLYWTQSADTLLVTHPEVPPQKITRTTDGGWQITSWSFFTEDNGRVQQPHHKFADAQVTLTASGSAGSITLTSNGYVFHAGHIGARFRMNNKEVEITHVPALAGSTQDPASKGWWKHATALVKETLSSTSHTRDWSEQAFSPVRGYPTSVTFHQDRLVIGGSRDLPNRLWLSKSADLFNFDPGEGLDDEAIDFAILSDQVNAIRAVFSGRHLQVFTSGAEWMVTGDPLTPLNIQLHRQTRVGSPVDRTIPPRDIDGATIFVPRNDDQLREFLFADVEQAYQATDLALLSQHLVNKPLDMDYDQKSRLLHIVMSDGTMGTLTIYRAEQVTAWTVQETAGRFLSVAVVGDDVYVLVERGGQLFIEMLDPELHVDSGLKGTSASPTRMWAGLDHLEGRRVKVVADDAIRADAQVVSGAVHLDEPVSSVEAGLAFAHTIHPLPTDLAGAASSVQGRKMRPVAITFRLQDTNALRVDVGAGPIDIPFKRFGNVRLDGGPAGFTGDKTIRAFGWQTDLMAPDWIIHQDAPMSFKLLSVAIEVSLNS